MSSSEKLEILYLMWMSAWSTVGAMASLALQERVIRNQDIPSRVRVPVVILTEVVIVLALCLVVHAAFTLNNLLGQ